MVVAYDEEYDDESSSETSSDGGASFDRTMDDDNDDDDNDDGTTTATMHDTRQRTLDDYVVRFSQQHANTDVMSSNCNSGNSAGTGANSSLHAPMSCMATRPSVTPQCRAAVSATVESTSCASCLPDNSAHLYSMPSDTRHENIHVISVPEVITDTCCIPHAATHDDSCTADVNQYNYSISDDNTASYLTQQENTDSSFLQHGANHSYTVPRNRPGSSTEAITCVYSALSDTTRAYCLSEDNTSNCFTAEIQSGTSQGSFVPDGCHTERSATRGFSVTSNDWHVDDTMLANLSSNTKHGYFLPHHSGNSNSSVSNNIAHDTVQGWSTQQQASDGYSTLRDNTHGYCTTDDRAPGYCIPQDTACGCSALHDTVHEFCKTNDDGQFCTEDDAASSCSEPHDTTSAHSIQLDTGHKYFVPHDSSHSIQDDTVHANSEADNAVYGDSIVVNDNLLSDDIHGSCGVDHIAVGQSMPDNTHASLVTKDNTHDVSNTDNAAHGYSMPDNIVCNQSLECDTTYSAAHTDDIVHSCSTPATSAVPDNTADGCSVPDDAKHGSSMPENNGTPEQTTGNCSVQQDINLGYCVTVETDNGEAESVQPVQNGNFPSTCDCQVSCPQVEMHSEMVIENETVSDVSEETLNESASVKGAVLEHSTVQETITGSCFITQPSTVITVSCALGSHLNSVVQSVKPDSITATQEHCCPIAACSVLCSVSNDQAVLTGLPSSMEPTGDQLIAPGSPTKDSVADKGHCDFQNTSCHVDGLEYACDSSVTSMLKCPEDNKQHEMKSSSDSVIADSVDTCHDEKDIELTVAVSSTTECDVNDGISTANSTVDTQAPSCRETSDVACHSDSTCTSVYDGTANDTSV